MSKIPAYGTTEATQNASWAKEITASTYGNKRWKSTSLMYKVNELDEFIGYVSKYCPRIRVAHVEMQAWELRKIATEVDGRWMYAYPLDKSIVFELRPVHVNE